MDQIHGDITGGGGGAIGLHAYTPAGYFYQDQTIRAGTDMSGQVHAQWPVEHYPSLHPMPGAGYGTVDVLTPQYDGESWSARNARLLAIRKERSRDAARSRRGKENFEFYELAKLLPLPAAITSQLDKASIIRLSISYLRMRDFANQGSAIHEDTTPLTHDLYENNLGANILQALDGFLFTLCSDGRFLYISETVSIYLGLSQVELTGSSMFDFVHQGDHTELAEELGMKLPPRLCNVNHSKKEDGDSVPSSPAMPSPTTSHESLSMTLNAKSTGYERSFLIRMKSTLTKRGVNFRSSGYKVIHITGSLRPRVNPTDYNSQNPEIMGFVGLAVALPPPTFNELKLEPTAFVCKVGVDFKITYCDERMAVFLDYSVDEVIGRNLYSFLHAQDVKSMRHRHLDMLRKGQTVTGYFRWMCKNGGYIWMQATAILLIAKNTNDSAFIFIMQVISEMEHRSVKMDISQLPHHVVSSKDVKAKAVPESLAGKESPPQKKEKVESSIPAVAVSTTNSKDVPPEEEDNVQTPLKRKLSEPSEEQKPKKRKIPPTRIKEQLKDEKVGDSNGIILEPFSEKCHAAGELVKQLAPLEPAKSAERTKLTAGLQRMSKNLETFDYQNNNNVGHNLEEVLKVPNLEKFLGKKRPHSPHIRERFGNSLPSSPTSSLRNFQSDSGEKEFLERQTSSIDLPVNEFSSRTRGPFPVINDFSKNSVPSKETPLNASSSEVFLYQMAGLPSADPSQIPSRDSFYGSPHPFMLNSTQGQYSPMAFPPFGQFGSLQQYGASMSLASRGYHPSSLVGNSTFLKGYQNPHDIPMDLSYSNLASYTSTPMPIMHTGVTPSSANSFPPIVSRRQLSNGEINHSSIHAKSSTDLHQLKS